MAETIVDFGSFFLW